MARAQWSLHLREPAYWVITLGLALSVAVGAGLFAEPNHGIVGVIIEDDAPALKETLSGLGEEAGARLEFGASDEETAALSNGDRAALIYFPDGVWRELRSGDGSRIEVLYDPRVAGGATVERAVALELVSGLESAATVEPGGEASVKNMRLNDGQPPRRLIDTLFPGILGMSVMFSASWAAGTVVLWRQTGALRRLAVSPLTPLTLGLSQLLAFGLLAVLEIGVLVGVTRLAFGVQMSGSYLDLAIVAAAGTVAFMGVWYLFTAVSRTTTGFFSLVNFCCFLMIFLAGSVLPQEAPPLLVKAAGTVLPLAHLNDALRGVVSDGDDLIDVAPQLLLLAAWAAIGYGGSSRIMRWEEP